MENKELLLEAINNLIYTKKQRELLKFFLVIAKEDNTVSTTPKELLTKFKASSQTIWLALKRFQKDNLVKKLSPERAHYYKFVLNQSNLENLLEDYLRKKNYVPEI